MKTFKVCLLTFLFFYAVNLQSQNLKHHFIGTLNGSGQFSKPAGNNLVLNSSMHYFLTKHLNIGIQGNLDRINTPIEKTTSNNWAAELRYYFAKNPKTLLFFHTLYFHERLNRSFFIENFDLRDQITTKNLNIGLGANFKIRSNLLFESTLDVSLTQWQHLFLSEFRNEKKYFSLFSNFNFKVLLPSTQNAHQKYQIVYFNEKDRFINVNGYLRFFGDTGQPPFELDLSTSLGIFRDNNWMWGIDSRFGYLEFLGNEGFHLSLNPFLRYYFSVRSRKIRPFLMAQFEITQHFNGNGLDPISGPELFAGLNYFLSPQIALDFTLGGVAKFELFTLEGIFFSPNLSLKHFL